jgi:nucleotidyltransferase substrate binding protein (TIGR01987 family)
VTHPDDTLPEVDLTPFRSALSQLEVALNARLAEPDNPFIRDAVIQRFEFTYELSIKTLKRYLRSTAASNDEVDRLNFRDLLRRAADFGVLKGDPLLWLDFRQARTDSVHTYNEMMAVEVASAAKSFAAEAHLLLTNLQNRIEA